MTARQDLTRQFLISCVEEAVIGGFLVFVLLQHSPGLVPVALAGLAALFIIKVVLFPWHGPIVGAESMLGEEAIVVADLDPEGMAKFGGVLWVARSSEGRIPAGEVVEILEVSGSKLRVGRKPSQRALPRS